MIRSLTSLKAVVMAGWLVAGAAQAHVTVSPAQLTAGGSAVATFRVGHACAGSAATTALRIEMPAGVESVRPQAKPGWSIRVEAAAAGKVAAVIWTGRLPGEQFDDFPILLRLPAAPGTLYFPAVQTCGSAVEQWIQIPDAGETGAGLKHPAPGLRLTPAAAPESANSHEGS